MSLPSMPSSFKLALAGCLLLACTGVARAQQVFTMKMSTPTMNDVSHEWMKRVKTGVESRSKGRVKVEIYPANQLGAVPRTVEGVALGTIEVTFVAVGYFSTYDARYAALDMPGLFDSTMQANRTLMDDDVRKRLAGYGAQKGIEPLACATNSQASVASSRPLRKVADFKGLKIRSPGTTPLQVNPLRALGASPVAMPIGEALPSLQNKTIDAVMASNVIFTAFKYQDVSKTQTLLPKSHLMICAVANKGFLTSMGPELEQIVREEAHKAQEVFLSRTQQEIESGRKVWEDAGGEIIEFPPAEAQHYLDIVTASAGAAVNASPQIKAEVDFLAKAAQRVKATQ